MRVVIIIILTSINALISFAGYLSQCEIEGVDERDWNYGKQLQQKIPDSQEGPFIQFNTKNVIGIREQTSTYFNATHKDNVLQLHPNSQFKCFEDEYEDGVSTLLEITINLECAQNAFETIKFIVHVEDINDNVPIFDRGVYEYHFGMAIPEDYHLTDILPISVVDKDFSNSRIYFSIEYNTVLKLEYHGKRKNYDENYFTTLKTLTEVKAPFMEEFTIVATDSGSPPRRSTAQLILTVSSNNTVQHNFIFSKSVYVAQYFYNNLQIEDLIKLSCPTQIHLRQYGFEKNFKIEVKPNGIVQIIVSQPIPDSIRSSKSYIIIELEATCDKFSEESALVINFIEDFSDKPLFNHFNSNISSFTIIFSVIIAFVVINVMLLQQKYRRKTRKSLPL